MRLSAFAFAALGFLGSAALVSGAQTSCAPTRADSEGPFYKANAPERSSTGRGLVVAGVVKSASDCAPLADARIEWWSANSRGEYDDGHRATQRADAEGQFRYETDFPGRYFPRPPHLHVRVTASGHKALVSQVYPKPGQASLGFDFVLVRE
jgi:protocatechuate 3,4-dioxygenase beta subunit